MQYIMNEKSLEYHWDILGYLWNELYDYPNESNVVITRSVPNEDNMRILSNAQFIRSLKNIDNFDDVNEMSFLQTPVLFLNNNAPKTYVSDSYNPLISVYTKDNKKISIDTSSSKLSADEMFLSSMLTASIALNSKDIQDNSHEGTLSIVSSTDEGSVNVGSMKEAVFSLRMLIEKVMTDFLTNKEMNMLWTS